MRPKKTCRSKDGCIGNVLTNESASVTRLSIEMKAIMQYFTGMRLIFICLLQSSSFIIVKSLLVQLHGEDISRWDTVILTLDL